MRNAMPELGKYPGDMPLMLVIWSPEEIQALADGMDIFPCPIMKSEPSGAPRRHPEDQRTESGISSGGDGDHQ